MIDQMPELGWNRGHTKLCHLHKNITLLIKMNYVNNGNSSEPLIDPCIGL